MFVVAISSYYLLSKRHLAFAKRSIIAASAVGLAAALCVVVLGDESGYTVSEDQEMKLAAIEAMWKTEPAPAVSIFSGSHKRFADRHRDALKTGDAVQGRARDFAKVDALATILMFAAAGLWVWLGIDGYA